MFKFLTNENKGESNCQLVQNDCEELIRHIISNEEFTTTIYPKTYRFNGEDYIVNNFTYNFDFDINKVTYNSTVLYRNYIVTVELFRDLQI